MQDYRLIRKLGAGGMGEVWEGRYRLPSGREEPVAIKLIQERYRHDADLLERFEREALTARRVNHNHPNLLTTFHHGTWGDGRPFLVMELVDGCDLFELASPGLRAAIVRRIACDLFAGLSYLHDRGKLHRDVTPGNILISKEGVVKLADFGLVEDTQGPTTGRFDGTLPYASPEALQGQKPTARSDLFSAGSVLYQLIADREPYGSDKAGAVLSRMTEKGAPALPDDTPEDLATLITGLMQPDPDARMFASGADAARFLQGSGEPIAETEELGRLASERAVTERPLHVADAPIVPARRGRRSAARALAWAALAAGLALYWSRHDGRPPAERVTPGPIAPMPGETTRTAPSPVGEMRPVESPGVASMPETEPKPSPRGTAPLDVEPTPDTAQNQRVQVIVPRTTLPVAPGAGFWTNMVPMQRID